MIRIKAVDEENILDVCELKTNQDDIRGAIEAHSYCNARKQNIIQKCIPMQFTTTMC